MSESEVGVQFAPRPGLSVVFGTDAAAPDRLLVRGRYLRRSAGIALLVLYFACWSQHEAFGEGPPLQLLAATLIAWGAIAVAFLRKRLVFDTRLGQLREEFALLFPFARKVRPLAAFRRVIVSLENRGGSQGQSTVYPVDLEAAAARLRVDSVGLWEHAAPLAETLSRFLRLPLRDDWRARELRVDDLDVPLRDQGPQGPGATRPEPLDSRVTADQPALLRVEIPRPGVPQTLFLVGIVGAFCLLPLTVEIVIPLLRGWRPQSLREALPSVALYALPLLIVGSGAARHVGRNGGTLTVTPEALRFLRHELLWRRAIEIRGDRLEDLTLLEPEMGGARSLLAYFSGGVIVARSDAESCRFGYGLKTDELEWLRDRIREVLRLGLPQHQPDTHHRADPQSPEPALPVFPRWSRLWLGMLAGGVMGRVAGGPLAVCASLPYLEQLLNVGALLGLLAGAAVTPSLWRNRGSRRLAAFLIALFLGLGVYALASQSDLVQPTPRLDQDAALSGRPPAGGPAPASQQLRLRAGLFVVAGAANALALNAVLFLVFRVTGHRWRLGFAALGAELAAAARTWEGVAPHGLLAALALSGAALAGLASSWLAAAPRWAEGPVKASRPRPLLPSAETGRPADSQAERPAPPQQAFPRLELPPGLPAVAPRIESVEDIDKELRRLAGNPALLFFWSGDRDSWLPDLDRLHRSHGPNGLQVIGVPRLPDEVRLRRILSRHRIEWRQLRGAEAWRGRVPIRWPGVVLLDGSGGVVYSGSPGLEVDQQVGRLLPQEPRIVPAIRGGVEGQLLFAGRPIHEFTPARARFWFRDEWSRRAADVEAEHDPSSSAFRWVGPAGTYLVDVSVGPRHDVHPHLSYGGSATFTVSAGEPQRLEVSLERILRLRLPVDNARILPPLANEAAHASPVRFAWDPIPEASVYRYSVTVREGSRLRPVSSGEADRPQLEVALPAGRYEFRLSAHGPTGMVGRLEVYGEDFRAWSYAFAVR